MTKSVNGGKVSARRMEHLDGLRGVAALIVVLFHFLSAVAPMWVPEQRPGAVWIAYTPVAILWNGNFAVLVFFVLSGFVVTAATVRKGNPLWVDIVIRYLRLAVPATISVVIAKLLLDLLPNKAHALMARTGSPWLGYIYQGDIPGFGAAALDGAVNVFLRGGSMFNNVLWTMKPEFIGSLICFGICLISNGRWRMILAGVLGLAVIAVHRYEYAAFLLGIVIFELWSTDRLPTRWPAVAMLAGTVIGSFSGDALGRAGFAYLPEAFQFRHHGGLLYPVAAGLVVYGCLQWPPAKRFFSQRWAVFLGAISFPLYLIHVPLIDTVIAKVWITLPDDRAIRIATGIGAICVMLPLAYVFEVGIERPFLYALGRLRDKLCRFDPRRSNVSRLRARART